MATAEAAEPPSRGRREEPRAREVLRFLGKAPLHILLVIVGLLWLVPTIGLFITSLLAPEDFLERGWWQVFSKPSKLTFDNYQAIFDNETITSSLVTTVWIAIGGTAASDLRRGARRLRLRLARLPGPRLVLRRRDRPPRRAAPDGADPDVLALQHDSGSTTRVLGLILFHTAFGLPFAIFLLRNFFIGIPKDLLEAARIDGASEIRIFLRLILPLGLPAIASLAIFQFLWTWNDLLVALTFGRETQPITVAIFSQLRQFGANIELIAPATFVSLVIPLVVFFAFQRYFVQGLLAGSVK